MVIVRLVDMQLFCGQRYRDAATLSREEVELLPNKRTTGQRGQILDRNNRILAEDRPCHDLHLQYQFLVSDPKWVAKQVREIAAEQGLNMKVGFEADQAREVYDQRAANTWELARLLASFRGVDLDKTVSRIKRRTQRWQAARDRRGGGQIAERKMSHPVVTGLDTNDVSLFYSNADKIVAASLVPGHKRVYPQGEIASHIIGITGLVTKGDKENWNLTDDELRGRQWVSGGSFRWFDLERRRHNYFDADSIGKMGVEKAAELWLRPKRGYRLSPRPGEVSAQVLPEPGRDVQLTIDIELQRRITEMLADKGYTGSVAVVSVDSREILALVSFPTYDLNTYRRDYNKLAGIIPKLPDKPTLEEREKYNQAKIDAMRSRTYLPLTNRAVAAYQPPGSAVKPVVALAGMTDGKISPHSELTCTGKNTLARNGKPRCWIGRAPHNSAHGPLDVVQALKVSCNIFFVKVGQALGHQRLCYWLGEFGYGKLSRTGLPEEKPGVVGTAEWLRKNRDRGPVPSDKWYMSIGQGTFDASPLQVANAIATIAAGGEFQSPLLMVPRIEKPLIELRWDFVASLSPEKQAKISTTPERLSYKLPLSPQHVAAVHDGMYKVVNEDGGTAFKHWNVGDPLQFKVCGKTGTAQASGHKIDTNGDGRRDTIVRQGSHAWFAGFSPHNRPQVAIAVVIDYAPGGGGAYAAPIGKEVFRICEELEYINGRD
ncbi:MAG: hypothetical protein KAR11_03610 [Phycisphaerae bacterium]|nr:hypothetical protein [Phycisphaerae bacterium]